MLELDLILQQLHDTTTLDQISTRHHKYLGKNSDLSQEFKQLANLSPEDKKSKGAELSHYKTTLTESYSQHYNKIYLEHINIQLTKDIVDINVPTQAKSIGHYSLLTKTRRYIEDICASMGFAIHYGHEMVTKFENFASVNIPNSHPATDMHDTIYMQEIDTKDESLLLRTHTSAMQNKLIKHYGVPCQVVVPGKVYRNENTDATHDTAFYQLEGIYVNKGVNIGHLKHLMHQIIQALLGDKKIETRMRPAYFPFTEPGVEIDARYEITDEKGNTTRSKWIEIVGAGMIHPHVLEQADVDPSIYSGFAFGFGINRLVAVQHSIKDIRLFTNGDLRFTRSF